MTESSDGRVLAVCIVHEVLPLSRPAVVDSAIDKRPVSGPVIVGEAGLSGDTSCDTEFHGGGDQAVYAYSDTEAARWADELGRDLPPGWFGENLRVDGIPVTDAVVGSHWEVGTAVLEVTIPRFPCGTFSKWAREPRWVTRFTHRADVGAYLRVVRTGTVTAGDAVSVTHEPEHGVTVRDVFTGEHPDRLERLLAIDGLAPKVYRDARRTLDRVARAAAKASSSR